MTPGCYALAIVMTGACAGVQPPPAPPTPTDTYVRAPVDATWQRAVDFLTAQRVPIQADRASGVISARAFDVSWQQLRDWADCGGSGGRGVHSMDDNEMRAKNVQAKGDVTVTIRGVGDSTSVRPVVGIGATWTNPMLGQQAARFECVSNGKFESALMAAVQR